MLCNILNFSSCEIIFFAAAATIFISKGRTPDDLNVVGNLVVAIGSLLLTVAALDEAKKNQATQVNQEGKQK